MDILVTGSGGFIGRHLVEALERRPGINLFKFDLDSPASDLDMALDRADVIFHLAGVNRPQHIEEFESGNSGFTAEICRLESVGRRPLLVLSSSIQAVLDNPYGKSKRHAEEMVQNFAERTASRAIIFRLQNVFGKWCRPNYNSVTATFCHNLARDLPITVSDPSRELELVYIDTVISAFLGILEELRGTEPATAEGHCQQGRERSDPADSSGTWPNSRWCTYRRLEHSFRITLGELATKIRSFRDSRRTLVLPSFEDEFTRYLYATYLSYLEDREFSYALDLKRDNRGALAEFLKSAQFGQIFVSRTKPGITRGNHYHHTKAEKFFVVEGEAMIRFRHIEREEIIEYHVSGHEFRVVDVPPGYTHSIENVGEGEMVVLFWASEIFDPARPDTIPLSVVADSGSGAKMSSVTNMSG